MRPSLWASGRRHRIRSARGGSCGPQDRQRTDAAPPSETRGRYRDKVADLHKALAEPATHDEALEIMRSLVEKVIVRNTEAGFEIELFGEIANMLTLSGAPKTAESRSSVKVVAGEGFEPPTLGL